MLALLALARDRRQSRAERADLEDAHALRLLLQSVLLPGRDRSLALVLALLALAADEAHLLRLLLLLLRLLRNLLLRRLLLRRLLLRGRLLRAGNSLLNLLRHLGNDNRKLRLHVCFERQRR